MVIPAGCLAPRVLACWHPFLIYISYLFILSLLLLLLLPLPPYYLVDIELPRSSRDTNVNEYGKMLHDLCQAARLRLVNGRTGCDKGTGNFTCHTPRGSSTVDYVITSIPVRKYLNDFRVGEMSANSDHCPLQFSIEGSINSVRY